MRREIIQSISLKIAVTGGTTYFDGTDSREVKGSYSPGDTHLPDV